MEKQSDEPPLAARLVRHFDGRVWAMHLDYVNKGGSKTSRDTSYSGYNGYTPDRHLPLLVELCRSSRNSPRTVGAEQDGESPPVAEEEVSTGEEDVLWTPWPENLPPVPPIPTALPTKTEAVEGCEMQGNNAVDNTDEITSVKEAVSGGEQASTRPSPSHNPELNPNPNPNNPSSGISGILGSSGEHPAVASSPWTSVASVTSEFPPSDRPDRRMGAVYRDLAERLIVKVRDRRTGPRRRQQRRQRQQEEEDEGGVVVEGEEGQQQQQQEEEEKQQQLWVAIAGAPGSGKSTLAVSNIM